MKSFTSTFGPGRRHNFPTLKITESALRVFVEINGRASRRPAGERHDGVHSAAVSTRAPAIQVEVECSQVRPQQGGHPKTLLINVESPLGTSRLGGRATAQRVIISVDRYTLGSCPSKWLSVRPPQSDNNATCGRSVAGAVVGAWLPALLSTVETSRVVPYYYPCGPLALSPHRESRRLPNEVILPQCAPRPSNRANWAIWDVTPILCFSAAREREQRRPLLRHCPFRPLLESPWTQSFLAPSSLFAWTHGMAITESP